MTTARQGPGLPSEFPTYASTITVEKITRAAFFACNDHSFGPVQGWTQAYRQHITNLTGFTQAQNDSLFEYAARSYVIPVQHGPLSAAYGGMLSAFNDVQEKKSSAKTFSTTRRGAGPTIDFSKLTWNPVSRPSTPRDLFVGTSMNTKTGVIKSIKKQGDNVVLYFKTVKYRVPTYKCKDTRRISYIESNGYVHYKQNCVKTGSREVVETNDPVRLPAFAATGLKPNMSMSYIGSKAPSSSKKNKKKPEIQIGWPEAVYKSKKQKKLVALYGVKL